MTQQIQTKQIPKGWKEKKIEDFAEVITGGTPSTNIKEYWGNGEIPWLRSGELKDNILTSSKEYITELGLKKSAARIMPRNSVLIALTGATTGKVAFLTFETSANQSVTGILPSEEHIPKFLFYYLQLIRNEIIHKSYGEAQNHISQGFVKKLIIPLPSLPEQTLIVQEIEKQFTRLDAAVKSLKTVKEKLEVYRKAVLNKSFYGNKKTFPEIISKEKHSMKRGPFGGSLKKEIFVPSGYLVYEQYHPINNDFDFGRYFISKDKFEEMKAFSVKPRDLLISCSGTIGRIAEIPEKNFKVGIINQALLKITLDNSKVLNKYFLYLFQSQYIQKHLTKISRGVAIKNVPSVKELKTIKFPIPTIQEQSSIIQSIESKFSVIDKIEEVVEASLDKSEKLRKSILKSAFEGKLIKAVNKSG